MSPVVEIIFWFIFKILIDCCHLSIGVMMVIKQMRRGHFIVRDDRVVAEARKEFKLCIV